METGPSRPKKEVEGAMEKTKFKCDFPNYRSATSRTTVVRLPELPTAETNKTP